MTMTKKKTASVPSIVISILLALALAFSLVGCGTTTTDTDAETTAPSKATAEVVPEDISISLDETSLIKAFCEGKWDGSFIFNEEHCASIEDGQLWIDCDSTYAIPDMGPYETSSYSLDIVDCDKKGTWVYDSELQVIELWSKGTRLEKIAVPSETYYTYVYKVSEVLVAHYGEKLWVYDLEGYTLHTVYDIIDVYQDRDGNFYYSTFEHRNFEVTSSGEIVELNSTYVRFPREQGTVAEVKNKNLLTQVFNLFCATDWDGSCRKINNNDFVEVDYYGHIFHNNKWIGDISLGTENVFSLYGWNMDVSEEVSYYLDGTHLVRYQKGKETSIDIPDGEGEIRWIADNKVVVWLYDGNLLIIEEENVNVVSTSARDMNVAYDIMYYMEGDTVYSLDWTNQSASPEVYFEGAYAVSPHEDEAEGAIVPSEYANDHYYGSNLYVPF